MKELEKLLQNIDKIYREYYYKFWRDGEIFISEKELQQKIFETVDKKRGKD